MSLSKEQTEFCLKCGIISENTPAFCLPSSEEVAKLMAIAAENSASDEALFSKTDAALRELHEANDRVEAGLKRQAAILGF